MFGQVTEVGDRSFVMQMEDRSDLEIMTRRLTASERPYLEPGALVQLEDGHVRFIKVARALAAQQESEALAWFFKEDPAGAPTTIVKGSSL